jgi:hypothetical protein
LSLSWCTSASLTVYLQYFFFPSNFTSASYDPLRSHEYPATWTKSSHNVPTVYCLQIDVINISIPRMQLHICVFSSANYISIRRRSGPKLLRRLCSLILCDVDALLQACLFGNKVILNLLLCYTWILESWRHRHHIPPLFRSIFQAVQFCRYRLFNNYNMTLSDGRAHGAHYSLRVLLKQIFIPFISVFPSLFGFNFFLNLE